MIEIRSNRPKKSAPGYRADLDVRAFYHDTLLASGCTCWYDGVDNFFNRDIYGYLNQEGTNER